jgi:hypothetical protein
VLGTQGIAGHENDLGDLSALSKADAGGNGFFHVSYLVIL